jgi:mannose-6-phosphate isomerase-like protein (cupin superfamily)
MLAEKNHQNIVIPAGSNPGLSVLGHLQDHKLNQQQTRGAFSVWVETIPAGSSGPPLHRHQNEDELFYVLDGEMTFYDETGETRAPRGTLFYSPRGNWHGFRNDQTTPAQMLIFLTPGGFEGFFHTIAASEGQRVSEPLPVTPSDVEKALATAPQYGLEFQLS